MNQAEEYAQKHLKSEIEIIKKTQRNNELVQLSVYEKAIIYKYSLDGYESLNERLRTSNGNNNSEFGLVLIASLLKLPNFQGLVFRAANLSKYDIEKYKKACDSNSILVESSFISASKSKLLANQFGTTLFRIYSKSGKEIEKVANFGIFSPTNEKEVLFASNLEFRILEVLDLAANFLITMEEI